MKIFYLRNKHGHAVACIAWEPILEKISFAVSTHNPIDPYNKEVGRALAVGRLQFAPHTISIASCMVATKSTLLNTIAGAAEFPTRTRNAAVAWLKNPPKPKTKKVRAA